MTQETPNHLQNPNDDAANDKIVSKDEKAETKSEKTEAKSEKAETKSKKTEAKNEKASSEIEKASSEKEIIDVKIDEKIQADIDTLIVAFGICARIAREAAQQAANAAQKRFAVLRPQTLWPIDGDKARPYIERARKICVVECNRGMMRADLARFIDETRMYGICRDGGVVPTVEEIVAQLVS